MKTRILFQWTAVLLLGGGVVQVGRAAVVLPFNYSETFDNFGKTGNSCPASNPKGICAAVAAINSFIFLENQYPTIYDNKLTPNIQGTKPNQTDPTDRDNFGVNGWQVGMNPARQGYYPRTGTVGGDYIQTKMDWINDYAPGTTMFNSWFAGSTMNNRLPTIQDLAAQMQSMEDVELFINGGTAGNHAIVLTGVACTGNNYTNCTINYQDVNTPGTNNTGVALSAGLAIDDGYGTIYAAFAESPVPEPASGILFGTAIIGLLAWKIRRKASRPI